MPTASWAYVTRFHVISSSRNSVLGQRSMQLLTVHGWPPLQWATQPSFQFCRPFPPKLPCIPLSLNLFKFPSVSFAFTTLPQTSQNCYVLQTLMVGNTTSNARNNWTFCIEASGLFDFFFGHFTHMNALASENPRARRHTLEKCSSRLVGSPCAIT